MENQNVEEVVSREDSLAGRRRFLGQAVMGGVAAFVPSGNGSYGAPESEMCTATAADSLVLYITLLLGIPYELLGSAGTKVGEAASACAHQLNDLYSKVKALDDELRRSASNTQASQLRNVIELGRTNVELIRTSGKPQLHHASLLAQTLSIVGKEVTRATQQLLPDQEIKLSKEASRLLLEIIELVKKAPDIEKQVDEANALFKKQMKLVREKVLGDHDHPETPGITKLMLDASNAIVAADRAGSSSALRETAQTKVQIVIDRLKEIAGEYPDRSVGSKEKPTSTELLIGLLEGAKMWVAAPRASAVDDVIKRSHVVNSTKRGQALLRSAVLAPGRISNLLEEHCGPGTWWRAGWCLGLVTPALFRYPDADSRLPLIEGALALFSCPGFPADKGGLAKALSRVRVA